MTVACFVAERPEIYVVRLFESAFNSESAVFGRFVTVTVFNPCGVLFGSTSCLVYCDERLCSDVTAKSNEIVCVHFVEIVAVRMGLCFKHKI